MKVADILFEQAVFEKNPLLAIEAFQVLTNCTREQAKSWMKGFYRFESINVDWERISEVWGYMSSKGVIDEVIAELEALKDSWVVSGYNGEQDALREYFANYLTQDNTWVKASYFLERLNRTHEKADAIRVYSHMLGITDMKAATEKAVQYVEVFCVNGEFAFELFMLSLPRTEEELCAISM